MILTIHSKCVGHFTQVVKDDSFKVGCSISKYTKNGEKMSLIACNYGVRNLIGFPVYEEGATASECSSGTNPQYQGLCNIDEKYEAFYIRREFNLQNVG